MLWQMGIYYALHVHGGDIIYKKKSTENNWFKPKVINILAQNRWSDASKSPRDKGRGEMW